MSHKLLMNYAQKLGHKPSTGGVAQMVMQAMLCDEMDTFNQHIKDILRDAAASDVPWSTVADKSQKQREILSFLERAQAHHQPHRYRDVFEENTSSLYRHALPSASIVVSETLKKRGGLYEADGFCGVYDKKELQEMLSALKERLQRAPLQQSGLMIESDAHTIALSYDTHRREWLFADANNLPVKHIKYDAIIASNVASAFAYGARRYIRNDSMASYVASALGYGWNKHVLHMSLYCAGQDKEFFRELAQSWRKTAAWKKANALSRDKVFFNGSGTTWLHLAVKSGSLEEVKALLEKEAPVSAKNHRGETPLFLASTWKDREIIQLLLKKGANISQVSNAGKTPLGYASIYNHLEMASILLEKGVNVNYASHAGETPLGDAALYNHVEMAKLLLENGANPYKGMNNSQTALWAASTHHHTDIMKIFLEHGTSSHPLPMHEGESFASILMKGDVDLVARILAQEIDVNKAMNAHGVTPLLIAAHYNHVEIIKLLLKNGADLYKADEGGDTSLAVILLKGDKGLVKHILAQGIDVNKAVNASGATPLFIASKYNHVAIAKLLLKNGADLHASDNAGNTPLLIASWLNNEIALIELLLTHGADIQKVNNAGMHPLWAAYVHNHAEVAHCMIKYLSTAGRARALLDAAEALDVVAARFVISSMLKAFSSKPSIKYTPVLNTAEMDTVESEEGTALLLAAQKGNINAVKLLLKDGAKVEFSDSEGATPLLLAAHVGHFEMVRFLLKYGAKVDKADNQGATPLLVAALLGHKEVVQILLENKARVERADNEGNTPLHVAVQEGQLDVIRYLLQSGADVDRQNRQGATARDIALEKGSLEQVNKWLAEHKGLSTPKADLKKGFFVSSRPSGQNVKGQGGGTDQQPFSSRGPNAKK